MTISHPPVPGSALWVHAHPRPDSLNGQLFTEGVRALGEQYRVATSDLYSQDFDPRLSHRDLGGSNLSGSDGSGNSRSGSTVELNAGAFSAGSLPSDVTAEQEKLAAAELLVFQFPLWWYGPPAILKGWLDRVLTAGFAFGDLDPHLGVPRRYGDGGLSGRRALVVVTAGEDERSIGRRGISGDVDSLLFPITHGALWYVGIDTFDLHVIHDADVLSPEQVQNEKDRLTGRLRALDSEQTKPYRRLSDGEYAGTRALKDTILPGRADLAIHRRDEPATA